MKNINKSYPNFKDVIEQSSSTAVVPLLQHRQKIIVISKTCNIEYKINKHVI